MTGSDSAQIVCVGADSLNKMTKSILKEQDILIWISDERTASLSRLAIWV